jgi:hypothetical protein
MMGYKQVLESTPQVPRSISNTQQYFSMSVHHRLYSYKNTNHQQMNKESFIINRNTLLHVSTLPGHLQGELTVTVTLGPAKTAED